jgi:hypothetical protein
MRKTLAAAVIAAAATAACGRAHSEDAGPTVARNFQVANFDRIESAGAYDVTVRTGSAPSVSARGPQKIIEAMVVEVQGGKLTIRQNKENGWFGRGHRGGKVHITVTVSQLSAATLAGAGDMRIDQVEGNGFEGTLAGAGDMHVDRIRVQNLKMAIAGAGNAKLGAGTAQNVDYSTAGAGDIDASGIAAQQAKISIVGAGTIRAHATGSADVSIVGAGDVEISGGAKCSVHKMGAGDVRCS